MQHFNSTLRFFRLTLVATICALLSGCFTVKTTFPLVGLDKDEGYPLAGEIFYLFDQEKNEITPSFYIQKITKGDTSEYFAYLFDSPKENGDRILTQRIKEDFYITTYTDGTTSHSNTGSDLKFFSNISFIYRNGVITEIVRDSDRIKDALMSSGASVEEFNHPNREGKTIEIWSQGNPEAMKQALFNMVSTFPPEGISESFFTSDALRREYPSSWLLLESEIQSAESCLPIVLQGESCL